MLAPLAEFLIQYALDGPEICVSNRFPGDADTTDLGPHFETGAFTCTPWSSLPVAQFSQLETLTHAGRSCPRAGSKGYSFCIRSE